MVDVRSGDVDCRRMDPAGPAVLDVPPAATPGVERVVHRDLVRRVEGGS